MYADRTYSIEAHPKTYDGVLTRRVLAWMIDYVVVLLLCIPAAVVLFILSILSLGLGFLLYPALFVIVAGLYFGWTVGSAKQASLGMRLFDIAVVRTDDQPLDFMTAIVHLVLFWLSWTLTPLVLLVGLFTDRKRLLHDLLIGTEVIRTS